MVVYELTKWPIRKDGRTLRIEFSIQTVFRRLLGYSIRAAAVDFLSIARIPPFARSAQPMQPILWPEEHDMVRNCISLPAVAAKTQ